MHLYTHDKEYGHIWLYDLVWASQTRAQQQLITIGLGILLLENYMIHNVLLLDAVWSTTCQPNGELKINDTCSGLFGKLNIKVGYHNHAYNNSSYDMHDSIAYHDIIKVQTKQHSLLSSVLLLPWEFCL